MKKYHTSIRDQLLTVHQPLILINPIYLDQIESNNHDSMHNFSS